MTNHATRVLLVAVLVLGVLAVGFTGPVAAQETRDADLDVQQPHYVDSDVHVREVNGSTVYEAEGSHLRLYPQSFDSDDVVDSGIEPGTAEFTRTQAGSGYALTVQETGTYDVYWIVERTVTEDNETRTEHARYEAAIRVTGHLDVTTISHSELEEMRHDADRWRDVNASVQSQIHHSWFVSLVPGSPTAEEWLDSSLTKQQLVHNPGAAFGAGLTMFFFGLFSLGGALVATAMLGWHAKAITWLRRRLNVFESVEAEEGELNKRFEQRERDRATTSLQNEQFSDTYLPHVADAMRSLGDTPHEADCNITSNSILPSVGVAYKARAMAQDNYVGILPLQGDDAVTDGGETPNPDDDSEEEAAELDVEDVLGMARARGDRVELIDTDDEDIPEDAATLDLSEADRDWLDVLPVGSDTMLEYDIADKDLDRDEIHVESVDWTVEEIISRIQLEARHFESPAEAATYFVDFLIDVREHPVTDSDGHPRTCRVVMETFLRDSQLLDDRFNISKQYLIDMLQAAIEADDPVKEGLDTVADIDEGKYA